MATPRPSVTSPSSRSRPRARSRSSASRSAAEAGRLGNDGVGAGRGGHDRIFADADAIALTLRPAAAEVAFVELAHAAKQEEEKRRRSAAPPPSAARQAGEGLLGAGSSDRRSAQAAPQEAADLQEEERKPRPHTGTHPAAPRPATPPAPGPAAPVPPPPPPPLLSTIQSPIAVYGGAFGPRQAERLLWRAGFGPRPGQAKELAALGLEKAVLSLTRPSGTAPMDGPAPTDEGEPLAPYDHYDHDLLFWLDRMVRSRHQLVERLALVFHDWFATSNDAVGSSRLMLDQTNLFRANGLGNFKTMVRAITQNPAMILFLDLASNTKRDPNENYARELMELFTLGADRGAYSEDDVRELARSLTGWDYDWSDELGVHNFRWDERDRWDPTYKTVFGKTGRWTWEDAARMVVDHDKHPSFFVAKLWSYFIPRRPTPTRPPGSRRSTRARATRSGRCSRRSSARPQLYDGPRMVKPPTVFVAGMLRAPGSAITDNRWSWVLSNAGQRVYYPPDVAGWDDKRWLDTNTTLGRWQAVYYVLDDDTEDPDWGSAYAAETAEAAVAKARTFWGDPDLTAAGVKCAAGLRAQRDPVRRHDRRSTRSARTRCASCSPPPPTTRRAESHGLPLRRLLQGPGRSRPARHRARHAHPGRHRPQPAGVPRPLERPRAVGLRRRAAVAARVRGGHRGRRRLLLARAGLDLPLGRARLAVRARADRRPALRDDAARTSSSPPSGDADRRLHRGQPPALAPERPRRCATCTAPARSP